MSDSRQRWLVFVASASLTALLIGSVSGAWLVWRRSSRQLQDAEFLQRQLAEVQQADQAATPEKAPPPVRVGTARIQSIQPQTSIVGRLVEVRKVTVAGEISGKIIELPVEVGTPVIAEQTVLARIDAIWSQLAVERYEAQVAVAQAQLLFQKSELERGERLGERNAITESEVELRRASVEEWTARLAEATTAKEEESQRVERAIVMAPFDGTVVEKHAEAGAYVSPGDPLVDIVSRGEIDVRLMVPESVVNLIQLDQELTIRIDALKEQVAGTVVSITPYGPTASRTFPVRVRLNDQDGKLKAGMSATAIIATGPERRALVVERDGVLIRPDGSTVWVADSPDENRVATVYPVPVTVSVRSERQYAIELELDTDARLLHDGTLVVIEGAERLRPQLKVSLLELETETPEMAGSGPPTASTEANDAPDDSANGSQES